MLFGSVHGAPLLSTGNLEGIGEEVKKERFADDKVPWMGCSSNFGGELFRSLGGGATPCVVIAALIRRVVKGQPRSK